MHKNNALPTNKSFWAVVFICFLFAQMRYSSIEFNYMFAPFTMLATWVHELGHGLGAILSGGTFESMKIDGNFGGVAMTRTSSELGRATVLIMGLLGPSIAGLLILLVARRFDKSRLALWILAGALLFSAVVYAGDTFTRLVSIGLAVPVFVIAKWGKKTIPSLAAQIIGIIFCLNAISGFSYFFLDSSKMQRGDGALADTDALAQVLGGPQWLWGIIMAITSLAILALAARLSMIKQPPKPKLRVVDDEDDDPYWR